MAKPLAMSRSAPEQAPGDGMIETELLWRKAGKALSVSSTIGRSRHKTSQFAPPRPELSRSRHQIATAGRQSKAIEQEPLGEFEDHADAETRQSDEDRRDQRRA